MNHWKVATFTVLVLSSLAATNVAPTKAELEAMYDKAFREFNAANYPQALKELDAIDARQPDLAESQNLRGVILMRQANYDQAETALQKALVSDPKFWNARFNLAEIPFLRKDWAEARKRFDALLQGNASELQGEAAQLIQYKILLTYLLQDNANMVDSILSKFELSPETPAASYSNAAIAFHHKKEKEAKDLLATAEKNFSPQLNKLFAESLYEVGWLQKPAGQTRAAIELTSQEDQVAKTKAVAAEKYEQAERAFQQRDLATARRLVDEADAADPNQPETVNLRGEILLAQKDLDGAESAFKQAAKLDPKMTEAQYNLAQIPLRKKEYAKAREAFEALFSATAGNGGDKNQTSQIVKFNIYLSLLLEGKDARAQKIMEQFKFAGDTPALYYAQAAWEFKHNNAAKANDWIVSARKIYSPALNFVFANSFYDLGWLQNQAPVSTTASTEVAKMETTAPAESSAGAAPIVPNNFDEQGNQTLAQKAPPIASGMDFGATIDTPPLESAPTSVTSEKESGDTASAQKVEAAPANVPPAETREEQSQSAPVAAAKQNPLAPSTNKFAAAEKNSKPVAEVKGPAQTRSQPPVSQRITKPSSSRTLLVGILLLAGLLLLAWVVISELRRRVSVSVYNPPAPATGPRFGGTMPQQTAPKKAGASRLAGGPPKVSLQLKASEPSVRRAAVPFGKMNRPLGAAAPVGAGNGIASENYVPRESAPIEELPQLIEPEPQPAMEEAVSAVSMPPDVQYANDLEPAVSDVSELGATPDWEFTPVRTDGVTSDQAPVTAARELSSFAEPTSPSFDVPATFEKPMSIEAVGESTALKESTFFESVGEPRVIEPEQPLVPSIPGGEFSEWEPEPVGQGQPIPYQVPASWADAFTDAIGKPRAIPPNIPAEFKEEPVVVPERDIAPHAEEQALPVTSGPETTAVAETETEPEMSEPEMVAVTHKETYDIAQQEKAPAASEETELEIAEPEMSEPEVAAVAQASAEVPATDISEPIGVAQDHAILYQVPSFQNESPMAEITQPEPDAQPPHFPSGTIAAVGGIRHSVESPSFAPQVISTEPIAQQPTTPATMPETIQTTPTIRTAPMTGGMPQPQSASGMHTAVQLTFSFEIASMQLTPSFKMGALQLKPTSKIVTMRLAPSQQPQPAMNLQVTFEVATVQLNGNAIGMIRLTPSQQQRPGVISSPAFSVAGLQLLGNESGAVQITPSQQGQASVHVTGRFQIATVEFSPSFEIASIVLNSTSKNVSVQLPGAGPSAVEGAPVFEVTNVQLGGNGEIGMMQLIAQGAAPKAA